MNQNKELFYLRLNQSFGKYIVLNLLSTFLLIILKKNLLFKNVKVYF